MPHQKLTKILNFISPFKSLELLQNYFVTWTLIASYPNHPSNHRIKLTELLVLLKALHYLFLILSPCEGPIDQIVNFDESVIFKTKSTLMAVQVNFFFYYLMTVFLIEKSYFGKNGFVIRFLNGILFEKQSDYFEDPNVFGKIREFSIKYVHFTQIYTIGVGKSIQE